MAGVVYLKTNRFEVKLEGITFKAKDFESLCSMDFLFPGKKIWARPPIVGIDVMCHPRDTSVVLVLLSFGVGCMILRFHTGDVLPESICKFLTDERIRFVVFGIPEKKDLFPFEELGLTKKKVDIGYLAAKIFNDSKYKRYELAELARKVLRVKSMIGLTEASSFERHEQIKCSICQLFITSVIGMALLNANDKKKSETTPKKSSFLKNLHSLPLFTEGWFKFRKSEKEMDKPEVNRSPIFDSPTWLFINGHQQEHDIPPIANDIFHHAKDDCCSGDDDLDLIKGGSMNSGDTFNIFTNTSSTDNSNKEEEVVSATKKPLKGILKCPSSRFEVSNPSNTSPDSYTSEFNGGRVLKRANSKGYNVSFK